MWGNGKNSNAFGNCLNTYFPFSSAGHILLRLAFYLDYNITVERFVKLLDDQLFGPCESYFVVTSK